MSVPHLAAGTRTRVDSVLSSGFGPGFLDARSNLYRFEYAVVSASVLAFLAWRALDAGGMDWLQVAFWALFPDLVAFTGIGLSSRRREWPPWGSNLYNLFTPYCCGRPAFS